MADSYPFGKFTTAPDFFLEVAMGRIQGFKQDFLVGINENQANGIRQLLWDDVGAFRTDPAVPAPIYASSNDAGDTASFVIANVLDQDNVRQLVFAQLNGQNQVKLTNVADPGQDVLVSWVQSATITQTTPDGDVYIALQGATTGGIPDDLTTVQGRIKQGQNITHIGAYKVPKGFAAAVIATRGGTDNVTKVSLVESVITLPGMPPVIPIKYSVVPAFAQYLFPSPAATFEVGGSDSSAFPEGSKIEFFATPNSPDTKTLLSLDLMVFDKNYVED